jgi:effector-binding domain-containing protein
MAPQATPEFVISQMRVQTMRERPFFFVVSRPTAMAGLDKELDLLMPKLEAAQAEAHVGDGAPVIIRYFPSETPDTFVMEVGIPVKAGAKPAGEAQVKTLPPFRCASLLYWGSLEHIGQAYETLTQAIKEAGLEQTGEGREWYYHFEGDVSPNNVIGLQMEIR